MPVTVFTGYCSIYATLVNRSFSDFHRSGHLPQRVRRDAQRIRKRVEGVGAGHQVAVFDPAERDSGHACLLREVGLRHARSRPQSRYVVADCFPQFFIVDHFHTRIVTYTLRKARAVGWGGVKTATGNTGLNHPNHTPQVAGNRT